MRRLLLLALLATPAAAKDLPFTLNDQDQQSLQMLSGLMRQCGNEASFDQKLTTCARIEAYMKNLSDRVQAERAKIEKEEPKPEPEKKP